MGLTEVSGSRIRARLIIENLARRGVRVAVIAPDATPELQHKISHFIPLNRDHDSSDQIEYASRHFGVDMVYGITDGAAAAVHEASSSVAIPHVFDLHALSLVETLELGRQFWGSSYRTRIR